MNRNFQRNKRNRLNRTTLRRGPGVAKVRSRLRDFTAFFNPNNRLFRLMVLAVASLALASIALYFFSIVDEKIYYLRYFLSSSLVLGLINLANIVRPTDICIDLSSGFLFVSHLVAVQLTVWDWQLITGDSCYWIKASSFMNCFFLMTSVWSFFSATDWLQQIGVYSMHISLVLGLQSLIWIGGSLELNWTCGLIVLVIINHVALPMVSNKYDVSLEEMVTVAESFTLVFAYNILEDAISNTVGNRATLVVNEILEKAL